MPIGRSKLLKNCEFFDLKHIFPWKCIPIGCLSLILVRPSFQKSYFLQGGDCGAQDSASISQTGHFQQHKINSMNRHFGHLSFLNLIRPFCNFTYFCMYQNDDNIVCKRKKRFSSVALLA